MKCEKCNGMILSEKERSALDKHGLSDMKVCKCEAILTIEKRLDYLGPELKAHVLERKITPYLILSQELIKQFFPGFSGVKFYLGEDDILTIQFSVDVPASMIAGNMELYEAKWREYVPMGHIFDICIRPSKKNNPPAE